MDPAVTSTPPRKAIGGRHDSPASLGRGVGSSPAYLSSIRKHSLYGTDDRVVIDPGSRIWKIGFSGESKPRRVFYPRESFPEDPIGKRDGVIWDVDLVRMADQLDSFRVDNGWGEKQSQNKDQGGEQDKVEGETMERREEVLEIIKSRLIRVFRDVYYKHLLTESRSRKVIIVTQPFLPDPIRHLVAQVLLENLQVRSVSFTPAPLLALMAVGRTTGLVLDVGYHESTVVPVFQGRVLSEYIISTGISGKAFLRRLELLVERFGRVPNDTPHKGEARVTLELVEEIRSRACFVHPEAVARSTTPGSQGIEGDDEGTNLAEVLRRAYEGTNHPDTKPTSFERDGLRWLIPAWVKERTAEVYFELGEGDDGVSLQEAVAGCLVKLPIDLRRTMAGSLLVTGGGGVLPGFTRRLRTSMLHLIQESRFEPAEPAQRLSKERNVGSRPFACLIGLTHELAILNDSSVSSGSSEKQGAQGSAPAWNPGLVSWIGGSLAGALQIGGQEYELEDEHEASQEALR